MSGWRAGLVLVSIVSATLLCGPTSAAPSCANCATYGLMSASIQRFHFPVNGPKISVVDTYAFSERVERIGPLILSPPSRNGAWFVGTNPYGNDGFVGRIESDGAIVYLDHAVAGWGKSVLGWGGGSIFVTDSKAGVLQFMIGGNTTAYSLPSERLASADDISFDNQGTLWILRTLQDQSITTTRQLLAIDTSRPGPTHSGPPLPGVPEAFEQDLGNTDLLLSNGQIVRLSGDRPPAVIASAPAGACDGSFALASDGSQWLSDPVGIYHIHTDGTRTLIRFLEDEPDHGFGWFGWPFAIAPDGAAWTNFDNRLCRIALNDTMTCAKVPLPQLATLSFARDGSAWYAVNEDAQNEIDHVYFNGLTTRPAAMLDGDIALYSTPLDHPPVAGIVDSGDSLWYSELAYGRRSGVANLLSAQYISFQERPVCGLAAGAGGTLWLADCGTGLWRYTPRAFDVLDYSPLPQGRVIAMASLPGHEPYAIVRLSGVGASHDILIEASRDDAPRTLSGYGESLTAGADARLYLRMIDGTVFSVGTRALTRVARHVPREFTVDRRGTVWYTAPGALVHVDTLGRRSMHYLTHGLSETPQALAASADGSLWFGYRGGLCRLANGSSRCFPLDAGLDVRKIVFAGDASVWFIAGDHLIAHFVL